MELTTMAEILDTIGIKIKVDNQYRLFDDVMNDLREKWNSLTVDEKQRVANLYVTFCKSENPR